MFVKPLREVNVVEGDVLKLEAEIVGFPVPEIQWFKDGCPIRLAPEVNFICQPNGIIGLTIDVARPEDAGTYTVSAINKLGDASDKTDVAVEPKPQKPTFVAQLQDTEGIEGFPIKMEVKTVGHPKAEIQWLHNGEVIKPDGDHVKITEQPNGLSALVIDKVVPDDAGEYVVKAINPEGSSKSEAKLSVKPRVNDSIPEEVPKFLNELRNTTLDEGQPIVLSAPFIANPMPEVIWSKDGEPLAPSDRVLMTCDGKKVGLSINPAEVTDAGDYTCLLANPLGEDQTKACVSVRKVYQAPVFQQRIMDLQELPNNDAKFAYKLSGIPSPDVTWYKNNEPISDGLKYKIKSEGDIGCLYVKNCTPQDAGTYKCVARNREGEDSTNAKLEVVVHM